MISSNPDIKDKMSQAAATPFPVSIPATGKDKDYVQHFPRDCQHAVSKPYVPAFTGVGNPWAPSAPGVMSGYSFCDTTPPADTMGNPYDSFLNYERIFQNPLPLDDQMPFNLQGPCLDPSPSTEEPEPTTLLNTKPPGALPLQMPLQSDASAYPISLPSDKTYLGMELISQRGRRRSAPEPNIHADAERRQKHANRRASHNIVEKRYRMNLNSKFRQLEYAIKKGNEPFYSLPSSPGSSTPSTSKNVTASASMNEICGRRQQSPKASIIDSALSFIESLKSENHVLKEKLDLYETSTSARFQGHGHDGLKEVKLEK